MHILDATCGNRAIWFNKDQKDTIYIDIRPEVNPTLIMNCTKTIFKDNQFDLIVFDPPHVNFSANAIMSKEYGHFTTEQIRNLITNAFNEFHRILKDEGFVSFKWNTHDQSLIKILSYINNFEPLFGQQVSIRTKHSSQTYFVMLKKSNI